MHYFRNIVSSIILGLFAQSALAERPFTIEDNAYKPIVDLSITHYRKRPIGEVDFMMPIWKNNNNLGIFDAKLKKDRKGFEYNLGLVYRHNFNDRWIFGLYSYFDRRRTEHKLEANQWTIGTEALSRFFDARFNIYLPQNKQRTIHAKSKELKRDHTAIYAISDGKFEEHTLPGYDIEVGTPLFGFSSRVNDKLGTKVYVAKYDFARKNIAKNSGLRLRLEQKLFEDKLKSSPFRLTLHLGTYYTRNRKWDNFVGLSLRLPLSQDFPCRTKMQERMMDTVVRDVDIRTEKHFSESKEPVHFDGKQIYNVYFVAQNHPVGCGGDGSSSSPICADKHIEKLQSKKPGFIIIPIGHFTEDTYKLVMSHPNAVDNLPPNVVLSNGSSSFVITDHFPELKLVKLPGNEVHTYSAVTAVHSPKQKVFGSDKQESQNFYSNYPVESVSIAYADNEEVQKFYEDETIPAQNKQQVTEIKEEKMPNPKFIRRVPLRIKAEQKQFKVKQLSDNHDEDNTVAFARLFEEIDEHEVIKSELEIKQPEVKVKKSEVEIKKSEVEIKQPEVEFIKPEVEVKQPVRRPLLIKELNSNLLDNFEKRIYDNVVSDSLTDVAKRLANDSNGLAKTIPLSKLDLNNSGVKKNRIYAIMTSKTSAQVAREFLKRQSKLTQAP